MVRMCPRPLQTTALALLMLGGCGLPSDHALVTGVGARLRNVTDRLDPGRLLALEHQRFRRLTGSVGCRIERTRESVVGVPVLAARSLEALESETTAAPRKLRAGATRLVGDSVDRLRDLAAVRTLPGTGPDLATWLGERMRALRSVGDKLRLNRVPFEDETSPRLRGPGDPPQRESTWVERLLKRVPY